MITPRSSSGERRNGSGATCGIGEAFGRRSVTDETTDVDGG